MDGTRPGYIVEVRAHKKVPPVSIVPGSAICGLVWGELASWWQRLPGGVVALHPERLLVKVIETLSAASRLACRLNGRKEQRDQDSDDRDNDEQFDQSESMFTTS